MIQGWSVSAPGMGLVAIGQMRQTIFNDSNLTLFQAAINDQFGQLLKIPFMNGNLIEGISLSAGVPTSINHGLQRLPTGYLLFSNTAGSKIANAAYDNSTTITLTADASTIITIWVF